LRLSFHTSPAAHRASRHCGRQVAVADPIGSGATDSSTPNAEPEPDTDADTDADVDADADADPEPARATAWFDR
jgi:hypothetical protein